MEGQNVALPARNDYDSSRQFIDEMRHAEREVK
jgi:hypothetical protein